MIEQVFSTVCDEPAAHEIPGAELPAPPKPLLRNMGRAGTAVYLVDMLVRKGMELRLDDELTFFAPPPKMMGCVNGQERTITYFRDLFKQAGWKLSSVHYDAGSLIRFQKVVAVPI